MQLPLAVAPVQVLSVSDLARRIRETLEPVLADVWVVGEISSLRCPSSGHLYFALKDRRCQIAAVMFRSANQLLTFRPADGMEVLARGRIGVYEVRGDLQLYVDSMEPRGAGAMLLALEDLKRRLAAEGLFAADRKRQLPAMPRAVGIVTALTGAAVQDMLTVLRARWPAARVVISPVRVQGKGAGLEIVAALAAVARVPEVDVVIVGRGGGSVEDLWAFNEEHVARAIAAAPVPVVSAVGHETDVTVADLVADCRAATPTAAAAMVVPDRCALIERLADRQVALIAVLQQQLRRAAERVGHLQRRLVDPRRSLRIVRQRIDELSERGVRAMGQRTDRMRLRVTSLEQRLQALSPLAVLERGYSIVRRADGSVVREAASVNLGETLQVRFAQGTARVRVEDREP